MGGRLSGTRYYRPIHGSAGLVTARLRAEPELATAEALAPGEMRRVPFAGELVGAARVRGRCAAIPLEAFDAAGDRLGPEEQGAYLQLLRLSYGEGRNFCRATKRDLVARLGTTERRLHRILDGLARKGFVRLLHRDNRGTALRVYLPRELTARDPGAVPASSAPDSAALLEPSPNAHPGASIPAPAAILPIRGAATHRLAEALAAARGAITDETLAVAARDVAELIADGATPRQVEAAIGAVARRRTARGETA